MLVFLKGTQKKTSKKNTRDLSLSLSLSLFRGKTTRLEQRASKRRPHNNTGFLSVQKAVVVWVRAKRGVDFEAATTVPRERERAREIEYRLFPFFSSLGGICTFCISIWSEREKKVRARARFFFDFSASSDDDEKPLVR